MIRWFFASSPLVVLLVTMLGLKWKARRAGFLAYITALAAGGLLFGGHSFLLAVSSAKGLSLALFVVLIIWSSAFMFQVVSETGAIPGISRWMASLCNDRLMLGLLISWCLSGVIQAVAGFGVPVAVCSSLMMAAGYDPAISAVSSLVGHAWAVTFGSMGSSYYTLALATGIPAGTLSHWAGLTFVVPTIATGLAVAHIIEGRSGLRKGMVKVLVVGMAMGLVQWAVAVAGSAQVAALLGSLTGVLLLALLARKARLQPGADLDDGLPAATAPAACVHADVPRADAQHATDPTSPSGGGRSVHVALIPYYGTIVLTLISQIAPVKRFFGPLKVGMNYPALITTQGFQVPAEKGYAAIGIFSHPAPIISLAVLIGLAVFMRKGLLQRQSIRRVAEATVKQCFPTTVSVAFMCMMALVMNDTGMTGEMALGVSRVAGRLFPLVSPFIGVLGCFMTGSNTNSNVLFGAFQVEMARSLGLSATLLAGAQSCGGSLGSSIAPAKVLLGSSTSGLVGREGELLRNCLPYCLAIVSLVGLQALLATWLLNVVP